jgi:peptidoglycan hydrolase CwlO-like protein
MTEMTESRLNKVLTENVRFFLTIGSVIVSITLGYSFLSTQIAVLQNEVDTIQNNHLKHIETSIRDLSEAIKEVSNKVSDHIENDK